MTKKKKKKEEEEEEEEKEEEKSGREKDPTSTTGHQGLITDIQCIEVTRTQIEFAQ
jgi:hypothetical protein